MEGGDAAEEEESCYQEEGDAARGGEDGDGRHSHILCRQCLKHGVLRQVCQFDWCPSMVEISAIFN